MPVREQPLNNTSALKGRPVFLSASIPDPERWHGDFDAYEITDAVVAVAKAVLGASGRLVCAAHPTIAPLLVTVANDFPPRDRPHVVVYQSRLFEDRIPDEIEMFIDRYPDRPVYAFGRPGGESRKVLDRIGSSLKRELAESDVYPALMRHVIGDLATHIAD